MTNTLSERDHAFITRYPEVFGPIDRLHLLIRSQGLAVADGWMPLLDQLCHDLTAVIREDGLDFQTTQVKATPGGLRFYAQGGTAQTWALINAAEALSNTICEGCGSASHLRNRGSFIISICNSCWMSFR